MFIDMKLLDKMFLDIKLFKKNVHVHVQQEAHFFLLSGVKQVSHSKKFSYVC